jgi:hypothetical protein
MNTLDKLAAELRAGLVGVAEGPWELLRDDDETPLEIVRSADMNHRICFPTSNDPTTAEHLRRCSPDNIAALLDEREAMKAALDACNWYWPEADTSSEYCRDSPREVIEDNEAGDVIAVSRGGVVETRYYAWLPPAEDADSDDDFEVDEATEQDAEAKVAAELARRAALSEKPS